MGKKKDLRRAVEEAERSPAALPAPPHPGDGELVQVSMFLTKGDRIRLKKIGIRFDTSLQRLGHRAWNAFLASHGQPGLTPVLTGVRGKSSDED